jgi:hypothetical protein
MARPRWRCPPPAAPFQHAVPRPLGRSRGGSRCNCATQAQTPVRLGRSGAAGLLLQCGRATRLGPLRLPECRAVSSRGPDSAGDRGRVLRSPQSLSVGAAALWSRQTRMRATREPPRQRRARLPAPGWCDPLESDRDSCPLRPAFRRDRKRRTRASAAKKSGQCLSASANPDGRRASAESGERAPRARKLSFFTPQGRSLLVPSEVTLDSWAFEARALEAWPLQAVIASQQSRNVRVRVEHT